MMCINMQVNYGLRLYLFVWTLRYLIIIIMQTWWEALDTEDACQVYSVWCVPKINSIFSITLYKIYGVVCFQFSHLFLGGSDNICTSSYYHHQIGIIIHYLELSHDRMMRCMSCRVVLKMIYIMPLWKCCYESEELLAQYCSNVRDDMCEFYLSVILVVVSLVAVEFGK